MLRTVTSHLRPLAIGIAAGVLAIASAQADPLFKPTKMPGPSSQTLSADGITHYVVTPEGQFPSVDAEANPPGSNFIDTVYGNATTQSGVEIPNTLPSAPGKTYNLQDGPVLASPVDKRSPFTELDRIIRVMEQPGSTDAAQRRAEVQEAIDILEGNPLPGFSFSGFPMLHYTGPLKLKHVQPVYDENGNVVGGNVDINMIYFGQRIESDTALIDPNPVWNVPWTITYHVKILKDGIEDFSPMVMYFGDPRVDSPVKNDPGLDNFGMPNISMDQTFFPMLNEGTEYVLKIKEAPGKYYNLTYTWGWRMHPPRVQVSENANKMAGGKSLLQHEVGVFGANPRADEAAKLAAIAKIGDLAPEKRMWSIFRRLRDAIDAGTYTPDPTQADVQNLRQAFLDFSDRTRLPTGVTADPDADITLFYVNNTIYGSREGRNGRGQSGEGSGLGANSFVGAMGNYMVDWKTRPYHYKVTLLNGDNFPHGYVNVDFGGSRGWENHFQDSDPTEAIDPTTGEAYLPFDRGGTDEHLKGSPRPSDMNERPQFGSGSMFTFGRFNWWMNAGGPWGAIMVPPFNQATGTPGLHKVDLTFNFEPSPRLRMYQFDPLHHDTAIFSLH